MNEQTYQIRTDEMEINLVDLFFRLIKKWKSLIAVILIGAVLGAASTFVEFGTEPEIKDDVLANMSRAAQYRKLYEQQREYNENSPLMQMDANNVFRGELSYIVNAPDEQNTVLMMYQNLIDSSMEQTVWALSGMDCDSKYARELVLDSCYAFTNDKGDSSESSLQIHFTVQSDDPAACRYMLDAVKLAAQELDRDLTRRFSDYSSLELLDAVSPAAPGEFISTQESNISRLNNAQNNMLNAEKAFSDDELAYYRENFLKPAEEEEEGSGIVKAVVLGVILGCLLWGGWLVVAYLLDKHIKTASEVQSFCNLPLLGRLSNETPAKGADAWYSRVKGAPDTPAYVAALVDSLVQNEAVLCGDDACRNVMEQLAKSCAHVKAIGLTGKSEEALAQAKQTGCAILVLKTNETTRADFRRELEVCSLQKINLLGMVVID